jgi:Leucine-rich repeat (LRR) protein
VTEEKRNVAVRRSPGAAEKIGTGASSILSRMVSDALAVARSQEKSLTESRFRIGKFEFRSPDYHQILLWADALKLDPVTVVERLEKANVAVPDGDDHTDWKYSFKVDDGAIVSLALPEDLLRLSKLEWVDGISIRELALSGLPKANEISVSLPSLRRLNVVGSKLKEIDLGNLPNLTHLSCWMNDLTELDLSKVPNLRSLGCGYNQLAGLKLSSLPHLRELYCGENKLTELDLAVVPKLRILWCDRNDLTELNVSKVPELSELGCSDNRLVKLDLSNVPNLKRLSCGTNRLTELDLLHVPKLRGLACERNRLTELDLSNVPGLIKLFCHENQLTELDLSGVPELSELDCRGNRLSELDLSNVPKLTGPDCREGDMYHFSDVLWREDSFVKYRACDPFVKINGFRA